MRRSIWMKWMAPASGMLALSGFVGCEGTGSTTGRDAAGDADASESSAPDAERGDIDASDEPDADDEPDGLVRIEYGAHESPGDIYFVNDNRSGIPPSFVDAPTHVSSRALRMEFSSDQKTANVEYRFAEHHGEMPGEIYSRVYVRPEGIELGENDTVRMFWLPLTNGTGSSGGGATDGTNGWSNAIGFSHRNGSPAPEGYNFFSYSYHMDRSGSGDFEMTDAPVWMDEWNLIEGYVRANTYAAGTANADGIMRYWVNAELAFERTDLRMTTADDNLIEGVGPLGYVVGSDLSGSALLYDGHTISLEGVPDDVEAIRAAHRDYLGLR